MFRAAKISQILLQGEILPWFLSRVKYDKVIAALFKHYGRWRLLTKLHNGKTFGTVWAHLSSPFHVTEKSQSQRQPECLSPPIIQNLPEFPRNIHRGQPPTHRYSVAIIQRFCFLAAKEPRVPALPLLHTAHRGKTLPTSLPARRSSLCSSIDPCAPSSSAPFLKVAYSARRCKSVLSKSSIMLRWETKSHCNASFATMKVHVTAQG